VILDDTKLATKLGGLTKTPYDDGITQTLAFLKAHP